MRIKLIAISLLLASCSSLPFLEPYKIDVQQGNLVTAEMREKISLGMSQAMVQSILGTPLVNDPFHADRWDYVYLMERGGKLAWKQRLTLYFKDGHLDRIDDAHMPAGSAGVQKTKKGQDAR